MIGKIQWYNASNRTGVIEVEEKVTNGVRIKKFFFAPRDIAFLGCTPKQGCFVRFTPSGKTPAKAGGHPYANDCEFYETEELAQLAELAKAVENV